MKLKIIDSRMLEKIKTRVDNLLEKSRNFTRHLRHEEWLDNQEVCEMLNISFRTLQSYRDKCLLAYCKIGHKCYYKLADVKLFVEKSKSSQ